MTSSNYFDEPVAALYDSDSADLFAPEVLGPAVDLLDDLAADCTALELAIGTGRVAVPLAQRGVRVAGLESAQRWGDWDRRPFTAGSHKHVSVWRRPA